MPIAHKLMILLVMFAPLLGHKPKEWDRRAGGHTGEQATGKEYSQERHFTTKVLSRCKSVSTRLRRGEAMQLSYSCIEGEMLAVTKFKSKSDSYDVDHAL